MATDAQIAANQRNAKRSTGPKTAEGKATSSRNATTHGLTAKTLVLPNENVDVFQQKLDHWHTFYATDDPAQLALVDLAANASWRLGRCARHEASVLSERVRYAELQHDVKRRNEAEALGQRLIYEPINRVSECQWRDPVIAERLERRADDDPPVLFRQLCATAEGVDWLRARWVELHVALHRDGFWHYPEKFKAMRLLGKRPEDLLEDAAVAEIMAVCFYMHPCGDPRHETHWDFQEEAERGKMGVTGKPMYEVQVEALTDLIPKTRQDAYDRLFKLYETEVDRLDALKADFLDANAAADRAEAGARAMFDDTPSGVLFRRYEAQCEREFHRAVNDLKKLRKEAAKSEAVIEEAPEEAPIEANSGSSDRPRRAQKRQKRAQPGPRSARREAKSSPDPGPPIS